jgi:hypothetical protein
VSAAELADGSVELFGSFEAADVSRPADHHELRIGDRSLELLAFASIAALEAFVEPPDVDDGRAFDATGRLLSVTAAGTRTVVREAEAVVSHHDELRTALVTALTEAEGESVRSDSLEELVALAASRFTVLPPPSLARIIKRLVTRPWA